MDLHEFIGTWLSKSGNILEILPNNRNSLKVNFFSGNTGKPVIREYFENKESLDMLAKLDFYESSLEVELWKKGKGFQLTLLYDWIEFPTECGYYLAPGITEYADSSLTVKYGYLFGPLDYYKRMETSP